MSHSLSKARLRIVLRKKDGALVFDYEYDQEAWTWSGSINGTRRFVELRGDAGRSSPSSFIPVLEATYQLTVMLKPVAGR